MVIQCDDKSLMMATGVESISQLLADVYSCRLIPSHRLYRNLREDDLLHMTTVFQVKNKDA